MFVKGLRGREREGEDDSFFEVLSDEEKEGLFQLWYLDREGGGVLEQEQLVDEPWGCPCVRVLQYPYGM